MRQSHFVPSAFALFLAISSSALAYEPAPLSLIDRPMTLPAGELAPVLGMDLADWNSSDGSGGSTTLTGESLKAGLDFGVSRKFQLGLVVAFPINPGAGFGSVFLNATGALANGTALRFDIGYERIGFNGSDDLAGGDNQDRGLVGFGLPLKIRLSRFLAFVSGNSDGASSINRFVNVGESGVASYYGAMLFSEGSADNLSFSYGDQSSGALIGVNLPIGLLIQPDPHFAITLRTGYSAVIDIPSGGSSYALHFIPIGVDLVVSPAKVLDIGLSFFLDGFVGATGESENLGYADLRSFSLWLRFHLPV